MKVSAKAEYACLAALALARIGPDDPPLRIREIAEAHAIPERYLVQILLQLKAAGLVLSTRGAAGGYRLARPPERISVAAVLEAIDGPDRLRDSDGPAARALAAVWRSVGDAQQAVLERMTIADLAVSAAPIDWVI
jgi:Rrf2 family protein